MLKWVLYKLFPKTCKSFYQDGVTSVFDSMKEDNTSQYGGYFLSTVDAEKDEIKIRAAYPISNFLNKKCAM